MFTAIEKACIEDHRSGNSTVPERVDGSDADWVSFGIRLLLQAGRMIRQKRLTSRQDGVEIKSDGSPATRIEVEVELLLQEWLASFEFDAVVVGEETGGVLPSAGTAVAIDPIDGTRAFLTETETYTTTIAVFRDGLPILGFVSNPTTGEIAYALSEGESRLLQLSLFGEGDYACSLFRPVPKSQKILVNVHPSRVAGRLIGRLYEGWEQQQRISMVRSPGGSPSWALLEAARGHFVYLNLWSSRPSAAYDLAAGTLLVRGAGGDVTDLDSNPIDILKHRGPFIAAIDPSARQFVSVIARQSDSNATTE